MRPRARTTSSGREGTSGGASENGLAVVDMDVELDLEVAHPSAGQLRVTLTNPRGTEAVVFEGESETGSLHFDAPVLGFHGDETINGPWTLRIVDSVSGGTGELVRWNLRIGSRMD